MVFPAGCGSEAWRFFAADSDDHLIFPSTEGDFGMSRRKTVRMSEWEVWLRLVDAPQDGQAMQAPPTVVLTPDGARYRCGRCGTVLVVAEFGALKGFVIHCRRCDRYNEVPL